MCALTIAASAVRCSWRSRFFCSGLLAAANRVRYSGGEVTGLDVTGCAWTSIPGPTLGVAVRPADARAIAEVAWSKPKRAKEFAEILRTKAESIERSLIGTGRGKNLARSHRKAAVDQCAPRPGVFDTAQRPLGLVQIDHTTLDVIVVDDEQRLPSSGRSSVAHVLESEAARNILPACVFASAHGSESD
jgi:hypothetical protein